MPSSSSRMRIEEKKEAEIKSQTSYKSTHSSRSSVLERAREYNRRIDEQNRRRTKSLEPSGSDVSKGSRRSVSAGRAAPQQPKNRISTHERAMASVRKESTMNYKRPVLSNASTEPTHPLTPASTNYSQTSRQQPPSPTDQKHQQPSREVGQNTAGGSPGNRSFKSRSSHPQQQQQEGHEAVVTPELLVDALSGHEDGLLAIAERMMVHYDAGYDAMGEAIIDAFADVQKLFQHVVEAAHMEGAAFEASRREEEIADLRRQLAAAGDATGMQMQDEPLASPNAPMRHDEFIDQDVKDVLTEAIRKGAALRDANKHSECYDLYDQACQAASSLLPVDSDHRGRLQLSLARAESMSADRACAILRYAMDDVLRSGMRATRTPLPDPSKRADVVLSRPKGMAKGGASGQAGVVQSSDEALASLMEEMKDIMSAPVYSNTPLQAVAQRFWSALHDSQKVQQKNEERLEQHLGKLKGDFLLAKAEWEEKLSQSNEKVETYKEKYERLKDTLKSDSYEGKSMSNRMHDDEHDASTMYGSVKSGTSRGAGSVASIGSGLAQQAKTLVNTMNSFNCTALNERTGSSMEADLRELDTPYESRNGSSRKVPRTQGSMQARGRSTSATSKTSRSFREYSTSPQRVDV